MDEEYIGYLKYEGKLVEEGLLDARKAAQALLGFDEAIRFFVGQQSPLLRDLDFELPVRLRKVEREMRTLFVSVNKKYWWRQKIRQIRHNNAFNTNSQKRR